MTSDSPETTLDGWARLIPRQVWLVDDQVAHFTGKGPLVTDDRPLPEYFLLRRVFGSGFRPRQVSSSRELSRGADP